MLKAALLDMYNGEPNRGIGMLQSLMGRYKNKMTFDHFDVRVKNELPDLSYDIYVFSGGPGHPIEDGGLWFKPFFDLIDAIYQWNKQDDAPKKHCLFICHSFQMACHHFKLGDITHRTKMSFGTYPVHKTQKGKQEPLFKCLNDPFYIADFRRFQVINPRAEQFKEMGAQILCLEKLRPHVVYERAIMAVRFTPEMIGTQFHPEANPEGMLLHFQQPERKLAVVEEHGEPRYYRMIRDLSSPDKIKKTFDTLIPNFLESAIFQLERTQIGLIRQI
jgi:homoserine O-succinyltransferase/O-acetyltransferase